LLDDTKASGLEADPKLDLELEKGKNIIDREPNITIATTKVHPKDPEELE
jgi:hypothetical protein